MSFNKTYFEIYAALVLCDVDYIDVPFHIDLIQERPDIQYEDIGVEVTRAVSSEEAQQLNYFNKISGKNKEKKEEILSKIDPKKKSQLWETENKNVLSFPTGDGNLLVEAINNKNKKIIDYKELKSQSLFVYSDLVKDVSEIKEILSKELRMDDFNFDTIFVLNFDDLIVFSKSEWNSHKFSHEKLKYFKKEARALNKKYFDRYGNRKNDSKNIGR